MKRAIAARLRTALLAAAAMAGTILAVAGAAVASSPGHPGAAGLRMARMTHVIRYDEPYRLNEFLAVYSATLRTGAWGSAATACPVGYMVTGGGASIGPVVGGLPKGIRNAYVTTSEAIPGGPNPPTTWLAVVSNYSGASATVTEEAICAKLTR